MRKIFEIIGPVGAISLAIIAWLITTAISWGEINERVLYHEKRLDAHDEILQTLQEGREAQNAQSKEILNAVKSLKFFIQSSIDHTRIP